MPGGRRWSGACFGATEAERRSARGDLQSGGGKRLEFARAVAIAHDARGYFRAGHARGGRGGRGTTRVAPERTAMRNVPALLRRELNAYFASVLGYVVMMFFLAVIGVAFAVVVNFLYTGPKQQTAMDFMFRIVLVSSIG